MKLRQAIAASRNCIDPPCFDLERRSRRENTGLFLLRRVQRGVGFDDSLFERVNTPMLHADRNGTVRGREEADRARVPSANEYENRADRRKKFTRLVTIPSIARTRKRY